MGEDEAGQAKLRGRRPQGSKRVGPVIWRGGVLRRTAHHQGGGGGGGGRQGQEEEDGREALQLVRRHPRPLDPQERSGQVDLEAEHPHLGDGDGRDEVERRHDNHVVGRNVAPEFLWRLAAVPAVRQGGRIRGRDEPKGAETGEEATAPPLRPSSTAATRTGGSRIEPAAVGQPTRDAFFYWQAGPGLRFEPSWQTGPS